MPKPGDVKLIGAGKMVLARVQAFSRDSAKVLPPSVGAAALLIKQFVSAFRRMSSDSVACRAVRYRGSIALSAAKGGEPSFDVGHGDRAVSLTELSALPAPPAAVVGSPSITRVARQMAAYGRIADSSTLTVPGSMGRSPAYGRMMDAVTATPRSLRLRGSDLGPTGRRMWESNARGGIPLAEPWAGSADVGTLSPRIVEKLAAQMQRPLHPRLASPASSVVRTPPVKTGIPHDWGLSLGLSGDGRAVWAGLQRSMSPPRSYAPPGAKTRAAADAVSNDEGQSRHLLGSGASFAARAFSGERTEAGAEQMRRDQELAAQDQRRLERQILRTLTSAAERAPAGRTGFDLRRGRLWPGATVGSL